MELNEIQQRTLDDAVAWLAYPTRKIFRVYGYAGTGKTTIVKNVLDSVTLDVALGAYTGKAAHILRQKTGAKVQTLHKLLYGPPETNPDGSLEWESNRGSELDRCDFLVLDEVSMVNERMGSELEERANQILVLGDPGQLPPIEGAGYFDRDEPDAMLTEVMRTDDDGILSLATHVREGNVPRYSPDVTFSEAALKYDQVIVGTHRTRLKYNAKIREVLGRTSALPEVGERLLCIRNDYALGLFNGQQFTVIERDNLYLTLEDDDGDILIRRFNPECVETPGSGCVDQEGHFRSHAGCFTWAYTITCHKAQGSEWDRVLVKNEGFGPDRSRWLYTAVTRAAESVDVVRAVR